MTSRGYEIPFGDPTDTTDKETCCGLGNRKDKNFNEILAKDGVETFPSTIDFIN